MKNLYQILGVPKTATKSDIKKAYQKLAMKAHPDRGGDKEVFQEITIAYETLSDDARRAHYDKSGSIEKKQSVEDLAITMIASTFSQIIDSHNFSGDYVNAARKHFKTIASNTEDEIKRIDRIIARLEKIVGRVEAKDHEINIFQSTVMAKISDLNHTRHQYAEKFEVLHMAIAILMVYSDDVGAAAESQGVKDKMRKAGMFFDSI